MASLCHTGHDQDERPAKRPRPLRDENIITLRDGHSYGNTAVNGTANMVVMGDYVRQTCHQSSHIVVNTQDDDAYKVLLKSLPFDRIDFRVNNVKKPLLSTCEWLFCHPHFRTWYESSTVEKHNGFLWIKGKPGCGKSTLMKAAFDKAGKRKLKDRVRQTIIPYFFNARASGSLEKSSLGLYRTIVHRLLSLCPPLRPLFLQKFSLKDPGPSGDNWTSEELQGFIEDVIESNELCDLYLFIDALDEAEYEDDIREMISFLTQLSDRALALAGSCNLSICLSSRHYPHISIGRGLSLVVEDQPQHAQDIELYIKKELTCLDGPEMDELRAEILNKSARIFLWVVLVVQILNKVGDRGASVPKMRAHLETIPANLNKLFKDILTKNGDEIEESILLLQWMLFCVRPLEPRELYVAIDYSKLPDDAACAQVYETCVPVSDRLFRYIVSCSRGLVEIVEIASQPPVVQFIHETVREFLQRESGLVSIDSALAVNLIGVSQETLRTACARCISDNVIPDEYQRYCTGTHNSKDQLDKFKSSMRAKRPFLDYAIMHLFDHAEQAQKHGLSQEAFLQDQMNENGLWVSSHRLWWNVLERYKTHKMRADVTLLFFLAERQCSHLLSKLPGMSKVINKSYRKFDNALHMASDSGYEKVVQTLIDAGADVNAQLATYDTVLQVASAKGHEKTVQILLNAGASTSFRGGPHWSALIAALECRNKNIALTLIDADTGINNSATYRGEVLRKASLFGHEKVVQKLLSTEIDIDTQRDNYDSAMIGASTGGHYNIVEMLIDAGADVNAQPVGGGTALYTALEWKYENLARLLVDAGADVNAQGGYYGNALQVASQSCSVNIIQMLVDRGADINIQAGHCGTALQTAAAFGRKDIVRMFLDLGANVNTQGGHYGNALQAAASFGNEIIVRMLLDAGADVNAQGGYYGNALQAAASHGSAIGIKILLDAGADINARGGHYGNALQAASKAAFVTESTIRVLLDAGADVNAQGGYYKTALQAATIGKNMDVVRMLIDHGAKKESEG